MLVEELARSGAVTAATAVVASLDEVCFALTIGPDGSLDESSAALRQWFDLASLTKPCVATVALALEEEGDLPLSTTVASIVDEVAPALRDKTLADLLAHRAGLKPWAPLYQLCESKSECERMLVGDTMLGAEPGTYSDLGYILWGLIAERATGRRLEDLVGGCLSRVTESGGLLPSPGDREGVHPCRLDTEVEQRLAEQLGLSIPLLGPPKIGQAQDGNARFLGGLAGHAGLFGSALDLVDLARAWMIDSRYPGRATPPQVVDGEPFAVGWARRESSSSAGEALSNRAFGHTGFTGSSLWIDPQTERIFVLATHRAATQVDMAPWRRAFHRLGQRE